MNLNELIQKYIDKGYKRILSIADNNWLETPVDQVINTILKYLDNLKNIEIKQS